MARRDPKPRDTKARILDAALSEFGARGFVAVSIDDIAAAAGVTKGAVYYYFADKDDLARDLQAELWERLAARALAAFDPEQDTAANLLGCFNAFLGALDELPQARFFLRDCLALPQLSSRDGDTAVPLVRSVLETGMATGDIVALDVDALARVLIGAYSEATLHVLETGDPGPAVAVVRHLTAALGARTTRGRTGSTRARRR